MCKFGRSFEVGTLSTYSSILRYGFAFHDKTGIQLSDSKIWIQKNLVHTSDDLVQGT